MIKVISHDLRNPLNVAIGKLQLIREDTDDERLEPIADAINRSLELIDDLLAFARKKDHESNMKPVDLANIAEASWQSTETADASITIETDRVVMAERNLLRELLSNLINNAVEHGGDAVSITIGSLDDGFYIADDGTGIDEDEREQVFEAGYTTTQGGTGMGLALVREIADIHGWTTRVIEGENGGARFEITGVKFSAE